tara:strand:- start:234 stop:461 length:228 start_codon:yes stop_codon:yes gene_type:complete
MTEKIKVSRKGIIKFTKESTSILRQKLREMRDGRSRGCAEAFSDRIIDEMIKDTTFLYNFLINITEEEPEKVENG